jgi:sugar phosphate isomerase/epimerase
MNASTKPYLQQISTLRDKSYLEIGFSNNIYDNPRDVAGSVAEMAKDFTAIEIEISEEARPAIFEATPAEYDRIIDSIQDLVKQKNLSMSVHAEWFGTHTNLSSPNLQERQASGELLRKSMRFAADISAKYVTFHPGYRTHEDNRTLLENMLRSLDVLVPEAREMGVELCIENMGAERRTTIVYTPEEQVEICKKTGINITLDIPHLASHYPQEDEFDRVVQFLSPYIKHVHIADTIRPRHRHIPIGQGNLPLTKIVKNLFDYGYRGDAIVEEFNKGFAAEDYLAAAKQFKANMNLG